MSKGILYLIATPIGNLEDVTFRAIRLLGDVSLIAAEDTRRTAKLLNRYKITTPTASLHEHNEKRRTPSLIKRLEAGQSIALVTDAGTPLLSDPGWHLVRTAIERGIPIDPVPGASAILAALAVSGLVENQFTFLGFPPNRSHARKKWFETLTSETRPLIIFEAPHRLLGSLRDMAEVLGNRQVAVCREMTKVHQELVNGPILSVLDRLNSPRGEFTIVVAPNILPMATVKKEDVLDYFGQIAYSSASRRSAIKEVATKYGLRPRTIYQILEENQS
jgi:16S rRNA (cytidine1402-2'-O)-methyltransferase